MKVAGDTTRKQTSNGRPPKVVGTDNNKLKLLPDSVRKQALEMLQQGCSEGVVPDYDSGINYGWKLQPNNKLKFSFAGYIEEGK